MAMHPTAEAYRQAMAAGDHTSAAGYLMQAHSGTYNSDLVDQIHAVGRMTQAQLNAPADDGSRAGGNVNVVYVNNYRNGSGSS